MPGLVDPEKKRVLYAENLGEINFQKAEELLEAPVYVENDANAAVTGEKKFGSGDELENLVTINLGSGIGSGIYYRGDLLRSSGDRRAGEVGFITLDDEKTWEHYCGGNNVPERYREFVEEQEINDRVDPESAEGVFKAAKRGDPSTAGYLDQEWKKYARQGISSVVNVFGPEKVTFSGSLAIENPEVMEEIFEDVEKRGNNVNPVPEMEVTELGHRIGLYGAAGLALETGFYN